MKQTTDHRLYINTSNKVKKTNSQSMNTYQDKSKPLNEHDTFQNIMATTHSQNQEKHTQNVKDKARQRKPISFSWRLENKWCRNGVCREWHGVFGWDLVKRKWIVTKSSRENWKGLKTDPVFSKHAFFATRMSRQQVARSSRQNTQRQNCEKFSKCFS